MNDSGIWTRPRFLLALLLAALVAGAVPVPAARRDKASGAVWRAASARPAAPRPHADHTGFPPLPSAAPDLLPVVTLLRVDPPRSPRAALAAAPVARSPLPRAPPAA